MFTIFLVLLAIPFTLSVLNLGRFLYLHFSRTNGVRDSWWQFLIAPLIKWPSLVIFALVGAIFIFFSFLPYNQNNFDRELVNAYKDNIRLYDNYSSEYAESARKQIEEYQDMQSEQARTATVQQLQFYSQQQDEVGNALTDKIQFFQSKIMETELEIHKTNALIRARENNKWYFWVK